MDKKWLLNNIQEAQEELADILEKLKNNNNYSNLEFEMDMHHAFYHLNLAYNTNKITENEINNLTREDINILVKKHIDYYSWN